MSIKYSGTTDSRPSVFIFNQLIESKYGRFFIGKNMIEIENYKLETKETTSQPKVGLRLQDVLLRVSTTAPVVLELRQKIRERLESNPDKDERQAVLNVFSEKIIGLSLEEAKKEASKLLVPYHSNGERRKSLIISSASSASASQETECGILESRSHVIDIPGAIEGRDTRSATAGDVSLISTSAGLLMTKDKDDIEIINLADEAILSPVEGGILRGSDIYYKSDSLLLLMLTNPKSDVISQISDQLDNNPLVYPYNLDEETQIALLWLARKSGVNKLDVNANSSEVAVELTRKGYKYPSVEDALKIPYSDNPYLMQKAEWQLSQAAREIKHHSDYVPGYVINKPESFEEMYRKSLAACMLLASRYGLSTGWVKPDRGTDGGDQGPIKIGVDSLVQNRITSYIERGEIENAVSLYKAELPHLPQIRQRIDDMWTKGRSWVIEAKTHYFALNFTFDGKERILMTTPSVHVIKGAHRYTISLQLVDGVAWGGNLICSQKTWSHLVEKVDPSDDRIISNPSLISELKESYKSMTEAMKSYVEAINSSEKYNNGQVRGGADLAICTLGGKFGHDRIMVAVQDYNARANGCETAYALYDQAQDIYLGKGEAVTRNITPKVNFDTFSLILPLAIDEVNKTHGKNITLEQVKLIAVSAGWGQIGMIGTDAIEILQNILLLEEQLCKMNIVQL